MAAFGRDAAREAVLDDRRRHVDQLEQHAGQHEHHAAVRPEPQHRRRGAGRAVDDRADVALAAAGHAVAADRTRRAIPADSPVLFLTLSSHDAAAVADRRSTRRTCSAQRLSMVSGVAQVNVFGAQKFAVRVDVDPTQLAARQIGIDQVAHRRLPRRTRTGRPARCTDRSGTSSCRRGGQLMDADGYRPVVVAYRNGSPVRLEEVAHVYDGVENPRNGSWYNGVPTRLPGHPAPAGHEHRRGRGRASRRCCRSSRRSCPRRRQLAIRSDRSVPIRESVNDVKFTLLLTVFLVILVIFLFLRNSRPRSSPAWRCRSRSSARSR